MKFEFSNLRHDDFATASEPVAGTKLNELDAMRECLRVAWRGLANVQPNPLVGACALDSNGRFLGSAAHEKIGEEHAEKNLIKKISELDPTLLNNATLFVSLEPCCHQGKTPPCTDAILKTGIRRVVYLKQDPNPAVFGKGDKLLTEGGVETHQLDSIDLMKIFDYQNRIYLAQIDDRSIYIGLKAAVTLTGKIGSTGDKRNWISCKRSRSYGHFLRLQYDAIAVGATTVINDNPTLNTRETKLKAGCSYRVIFDPEWKALMHRELNDQKLLEISPDRVIWLGHIKNINSSVASRIDELAKLSAKVYKSKNRQVGYNELTDILRENSLNSMLIEGGSGLYNSALLNYRPQFIHYFIAPKIWLNDSCIGIGAAGSTLKEIKMLNPKMTQLDQDLLIESQLDLRV